MIRPFRLSFKSFGCFCFSLLAFSHHAWALSVTPSPSINGSYTVSWSSSFPMGCTYSYPYPGWPVYTCYMLLEKAGDGSWVGVSTAANATSWSTSGRTQGTYQYQIEVNTGDYFSQSQYIVDGPVSLSVGIPPLPSNELRAYAVKTGDLDGDGDIDIYVKRVAGTAWDLPLPEFVLRHNSNGTFSVETSISWQSRYLIDQWPAATILPQLADFNADGYQDILLTGLASAGVASADLVVFASNGPGAPPYATRLLDDDVKKFALDLLGYLNDYTYFNAAFRTRCVIEWGLQPWPVYHTDGSFWFDPIWIAVRTCYEVLDSNYSQTAFNIAWSMALVRDAGTLDAGTPPAISISTGFSQLFGVPFMGNVLQGAAWVASDYLHEAQMLGVYRLAAATQALEQLWWWVKKEEFSNQPHYYHVLTKICDAGQTGCTLSNVYHRMKQVPVTGWSDLGCNGQYKPTSQCSEEVHPGALVHVEIMDLAPVTFGEGGVVQVTYDAPNCLTNTTQPGHIFYPGTVTRCASQQADGSIWIDTVGTGTGQMKDVNEVVGTLVFKNIDIGIYERILLEGYGIVVP